MTDRHLYGLRWFARTVLAIGVAVSIAANILHAQPHPIARAISAWAPLALLLVIELISRVPVHTRWKRHLRLTATIAIAGIAAWISYWHMAGVVARYETGITPYLLPAAVDGLIIVASISLVEITARIRDRHPTPGAEPTARAGPAAPARVITDTSDTSDSFDTSVADMPVVTTEPMPALDRHLGVSHPEPELSPPSAEHDANDETPSNANSPTEYDDNEATDERHSNDRDHSTVTVAPDLLPLLPAARAARDTLVHQGRTVSRDALAALLRSNGHTIRNNRVSELLSVLKAEAAPVNGRNPQNHHR